MSEQPNLLAQQRELGEKWLDISIERYRANLKKQRIGQTQELYNSFQGRVSSNTETELKMRLVYAMQGLYVDAGLGRVKGAASAEERRFRNKRGRFQRQGRKAKRWYAKQAANEVHRLGVLVSELTGQLMVASAQASLPTDPVTVSF
ncbi:hypothetical protein [Hymenobacter sp.]|uniref:hypothetical protein n=1 Tax=Hymenobacter sp. TaxID=1898978 RepID=UPI00286C293D|nr:hypothetical protein [Hymenobacter sp.]